MRRPATAQQQATSLVGPDPDRKSSGTNVVHLFEPASSFKTVAPPQGADPSSLATEIASGLEAVHARKDAGKWREGLTRIRRLAGLAESFRNQIPAFGEPGIAQLVDLLDATIAAAPSGEQASSDFAELHNFLGNALGTLDDWRPDEDMRRRAVAAYRKAAGIWGARGEAAARIRAEINLGFALTRQSEDDEASADAQAAGPEAVRILQSAIAELVPDSVDWERAHLNLANALAARQFPAEAIEAYQKAITDRYRRADPLGWALAQNSYSAVLSDLGHYREAIDACRAALALLEPYPLELARCQYNLGNAYRRLGEQDSDKARLEAAVTAYHEALPRLPPVLWANAQYALGQAFHSLGRLDDAIAALRAAAEPATHVSSDRRAMFLRSLSALLREKAESQHSLESAYEAARVSATALSILPEDSDLVDTLMDDIRIVFNVIDVLSLGVDKKTTIARKFEAFLQTIGVEPPDLRASLAARVLPIIESAAIGATPATVPSKPAEIQWPTETYSEAHRTRGENIVQFLERVWSPLIQAGEVDRRNLRKVDPSADMAIANYTRAGRSLPTSVSIPRVKDITDAKASALPSGPETLRLARAMEARRKRARRSGLTD